MLEVFAFLQYYGLSGGGTFGNLLAQWQAAGVFSFMLPFLLLFALTYGILMRVGIFTTRVAGESNPNKTINAIIALATSLMALQFDFVSIFFAELFPRFGVGLAVILVVLVLAGLFIPYNKKGFNWGLIVFVLLVTVGVLYQSFEGFGAIGGGYFWNFLSQYFGVIVIIALIVAIVSGTTKSEHGPKNILEKVLSGE